MPQSRDADGSSQVCHVWSFLKRSTAKGSHRPKAVIVGEDQEFTATSSRLVALQKAPRKWGVP